jgi:hypothetical protein
LLLRRKQQQQRQQRRRNSTSYTQYDIAWHTNYVAIKTTHPNVLDFQSNNRKALLMYDNVERCCSEIRVLIRLQENPSHFPYMYEYFIDPMQDWQNQEPPTPDLHVVMELLGEELDVWRQKQSPFFESDAIHHVATITCTTYSNSNK